MKKIILTSVALGLLLSSTPVSFAASNSQSKTEIPSGKLEDFKNFRDRVELGDGIFEGEDPNAPKIVINEAQNIRATNHIGGAYTGEFDAIEANGSTMNIWVKNNTSTAVTMQVFHNGALFTTKQVSGNKQYTQTFSGNIKGHFKVYIFNSNGSSLNLSLSARQF